YLGAAVVAVLAELGDQHLRLALARGGDSAQPLDQRRVFRLVAIGRAIDLAHHLWPGLVVAEGAAQRIRNLADGGAGACRLDCCGENVALARPRDVVERRKRFGDAGRIALALDLLEPPDLRLAHGPVVDRAGL